MKDDSVIDISKEVQANLISRASLSALAHIVLVAIIWKISPIVDEDLNVKFFAFAAATLGVFRLILSLSFSFVPEKHQTLACNVLRSLVVVTGLSWGLIGYHAINNYGLTLDSVILLIPIAGVSAGAMTSLYYESLVLNLFIIASLTPSIVAEILIGSSTSIGLSLMTTSFVAFLLIQSKRLCSTSINSIHFRNRIIFEKNKNLALLETIPAFISWVDKSGHYLGVNNMTAQTYGVKADYFIGKEVGSIQNDLRFKTLVMDFLDSGNENETHEILSHTPNGDRWLLIAMKRYNFGYGDETVIIGLDIHEKKTTEKDLEIARAASISSSKMASVGQMAGNLAHEINNPLAIISGKSQRIRKILTAHKGHELDAAIKDIDAIEATVIRITKIINGLRTFTRNGEQDKLEKTSVVALIEDALEMCKGKFQNHSVDIKVLPISDKLDIMCRPVQIGQVLLNLLTNAFDAIQELEEKWIKISIEASEHEVLIKVTDSGAGIPADIQEKLMQPFFTTKPVGKGTGLGLSISRKILESHGGKFYLDKSSTNTCFAMSFPNLVSKDSKDAA